MGFSTFCNCDGLILKKTYNFTSEAKPVPTIWLRSPDTPDSRQLPVQMLHPETADCLLGELFLFASDMNFPLAHGVP